MSQKIGISLFVVFVFIVAGLGWVLMSNSEPVERIPRAPKKTEKKEWTFDDDISEIDLSVIAEEPSEPIKSKETLRRERLIQGEWRLTRRYTSFEAKFYEYDDSKQGYVTLSDNIFTLSVAGIDFSGEFEVLEPILLGSVPMNLHNSNEFLLHVMNMASSMSLVAKPHVFYWVEVRGNKLVLSHLGTHISKRKPPKEVLYFQR